MLKKLLVKLITLYQQTLSPDEGWFKLRYPGGYCRFEPHCSEYGKGAIEKYGAARGMAMAFWRILRCNPWSRGGRNYP